MRGFLALALALFLTILPGQADRPYVAVFASADLYVCYLNIHHKIDLLYKARSFKDLDKFLKKVSESGQDQIVLDLSIHGEDAAGLFAIANNPTDDVKKDDVYWASAGMIFTHIDTYLGGKNLIVILESCHGSVVLHKTLHTSGYYRTEHFWLENYNGDAPAYPIYSVGNEINLATLSLEQFLHNEFISLREVHTDEDWYRPRQTDLITSLS